MKNVFASFLILICILSSPGAAGALIFTPIVDPNVSNPGSDLYVPEFNGNESSILAATSQAWNQDIEKLKALEKKYPGKGFQGFAEQLQARQKYYLNTTTSKGWSAWGSTPAYVSADNTVCLTDLFFSSTYQPEDRIAILIHEMQHIEQYRLYRFGSNLLNLSSFGFIAKPAETDSYIEEYKWLRIFGSNQGFEMQNVIFALIEQGVIKSAADTDLLDQQLGIQILSKITAQGLDKALNGEENILPGDSAITPLSVLPNISTSLVGAISEFSLPQKPINIPARVQGKTGFTIPGPGTMTLKVGFASSKEYGPRFVGDELGYRNQAYLIFKHSAGEVKQSFSNGYNKDWAYVSIDRHFDGYDSCTLTVIPQGCSAGISPVTGELVEMSDGSGYIYYGGAYKLELLFKPDQAESAKAPDVVPGNINVSINGQPLLTDVSPVILGGRTMVPLRAIFEALQAEVYWDADTKTAVGIKSGTIIKLVIDQATALINDQPVELDVPATIINGRTMVPARFISESLGKQVEWDALTQTVRISD